MHELSKLCLLLGCSGQVVFIVGLQRAPCMSCLSCVYCWVAVGTMHELFLLVLNEKNLSKAGDLFSLDDKDIEDGLTDVLHKMRLIADVPQYLQNDNDQSVVEICITRVTVRRQVMVYVKQRCCCSCYNCMSANSRDMPYLSDLLTVYTAAHSVVHLLTTLSFAYSAPSTVLGTLFLSRSAPLICFCFQMPL